MLQLHSQNIPLAQHSLKKAWVFRLISFLGLLIGAEKKQLQRFGTLKRLSVI